MRAMPILYARMLASALQGCKLGLRLSLPSLSWGSSDHAHGRMIVLNAKIRKSCAGMQGTTCTVSIDLVTSLLCHAHMCFR